MDERTARVLRPASSEARALGAWWARAVLRITGGVVALVLVLPALPVLAGISVRTADFGPFGLQHSFDMDEWKRDTWGGACRAEMLDSLFGKHLALGMSIVEVDALLGAPLPTSRMGLHHIYALGVERNHETRSLLSPSTVGQSLIIGFSNERVTGWRVKPQSTRFDRGEQPPPR